MCSAGSGESEWRGLGGRRGALGLCVYYVIGDELLE